MNLCPCDPNEIRKIDQAATSGLSGTVDSLAYRVNEIERHLHNANLCYGKAAGDNFLLDSIVTFQAVAGAGSAFGAEKLCHDGTVVGGGSATQKMDLGRVVITASSAGAGVVYELQFLYGTGLIGTAVVLSTFYYVVPAAGAQKTSAVVFPCPRVACNNKIWAKTKCGTDAATINFLFEVHVYPA
jgi:hypothetical protein